MAVMLHALEYPMKYLHVNHKMLQHIHKSLKIPFTPLSSTIYGDLWVLHNATELNSPAEDLK